LLSSIVFTSCDSDEVGDNLYTFTDQMAGQYINSDTTLSEFARLIEITNTKGLLNSYGSYTCFAPTNAAMHSYYKLKGKKSLTDFSADSLKSMAYDHLIDGYSITHFMFNNGRLSNLTMNERYLAISFSDSGQIFVNKNSEIIVKDIIVHNGVIHKLNKVLDPVRDGVAEVIAKDSTFSLFYEALVATGLVDSILKTIDDNYVMTSNEAKILEDAVITTVASERHAPMSPQKGYTFCI